MGLLNYTTAKINELLARVAALPAKVMDGDTKIPSKTSDLENDSKFVKETGLKTVNGHSLLGTGDLTISGGSGGGVADSVDWSKVLNKPGWVNSQTKPSYTASEVGALPSDTAIPSKTSQLTNDSKFVKETGLKTINGQSLLGTGNISISGGSGEVDSGGNVNVTNATELKAVRNYVFKPSNDGSTDGAFVEIKNASKNNDGLISKEDYSKLKKIKESLNIPAAVINLSEKSSNEEIVAAWGDDPSFVYGVCGYIEIANSQDFIESFWDHYIGNYRCTLNAKCDESSGKNMLEISYIAFGGKLRTIRINVSKSDDTYAHTCEIEESGNDTYYLPFSVQEVDSGISVDDIKSALGGQSGVNDLKEAISNCKKIYIMRSDSNTFSTIPVTARLYKVANVFNYIQLYFIYCKSSALYEDPCMKTIFLYFTNNLTMSSPTVKTLYLSGYKLRGGILNLSNDSTSEDISSAVGGESGLKNIIHAVKNGNQLLLQGILSDSYYSVNLSCGIMESDNGDIQIVLSGQAYGLWGGTTCSSCGISYCKADNTFSCIIIN